MGMGPDPRLSMVKTSKPRVAMKAPQANYGNEAPSWLKPPTFIYPSGYFALATLLHNLVHDIKCPRASGRDAQAKNKDFGLKECKVGQSEVDKQTRNSTARMPPRHLALPPLSPSKKKEKEEKTKPKDG